MAEMGLERWPQYPYHLVSKQRLRLSLIVLAHLPEGETLGSITNHRGSSRLTTVEVDE